jgi:hypothetical protein
VLTATANVQASVAYVLNMTIADVGDGRYDSAVFLEGGSFNIIRRFGAASCLPGSFQNIFEPLGRIPRFLSGGRSGTALI